MSVERFRRVESIFLAACELEPRAREEFLASACGDDAALRREVESMLREDAEPALQFDTPQMRGPAQALFDQARDHDPAADVLPQRIGRYAIVRRLAVGGMGTVFEAEQDSPKRRVALKMVRTDVLSPALRRRFQYETELLGLLQHPGIAQIFEAGIADSVEGGQPYFAMEFIDGVTLAEHLDREGSDRRERLRTLIRVCEAVEHAHQKGVIHRDLKPANILVDATGQPKILDFGIARATDLDIRATVEETGKGQLLGTLAYMSPEQLTMPSRSLDTRSDVYALGVIAHELLTGELPYPLADKGISEVVRTIVETEPTRLGSRDRAMRGDLENIVGKALDKDRDRRYPSASAFADDIQRYLDDVPIAARPTSAIYHARKFARRNKALVGGIAIAMLALATGVVVSTSMYLKAEAARVQTAREEAKSRAVYEFVLEDLLESANPMQEFDRDVTVAAALARSVDRIAETFGGQPELEAAVRHTIGATFNGLGRLKEAHVQLRAALDLRRSLPDGDEAELADTLLVFSGVLSDEAHLESAELRCREALAIRRRLFGERSTEVAECLMALGGILASAEQHDAASAALTESLDIYRSVHGEEHRTVARNLAEIGVLEDAMGNYEKAAATFRKVLQLDRRVLEPDSLLIASDLNNLSALEDRLGESADAEQHNREAFAIYRDKLGEEHLKTLGARTNLANLLRRLGKSQEAETLIRKGLELSTSALGETHPQTLTSLNVLALILFVAKNYDEAEPLYRRAREISQKLNGPVHRDTLAPTYNLAWLHRKRGELDEAEKLFRSVSAGFRELLGPDHPDTLAVTNGHGQVLMEQQKYADAAVVYTDYLAARRRTAGDERDKNIDLLFALYQLGDCWMNAGMPAKARPLLEECVRECHASLKEDDWRIADAEGKLGACLMATDEWERGEGMALRALEQLDANAAVPPQNKEAARRNLIEAYERAGMPEKAARYR